MKKHDGVLAYSQSEAVYNEKKAEQKARDDLAHMSLKHARDENLLRPHRQIGGESFHDSHTSNATVTFVETEMTAIEEEEMIQMNKKNNIDVSAFKKI